MTIIVCIISFMIFQVIIICLFILIISYNGNIFVKSGEAVPSKTQKSTNSIPSESNHVDSRPSDPKPSEPGQESSVSEGSTPTDTIPQRFIPSGLKLPDLRVPSNGDYRSLLDLSCIDLQNLKQLVDNYEVEILLLNRLIGLHKERERLRTELSDLIRNACASPADGYESTSAGIDPFREDGPSSSGDLTTVADRGVVPNIHVSAVRPQPVKPVTQPEKPVIHDSVPVLPESVRSTVVPRPKDTHLTGKEQIQPKEAKHSHQKVAQPKSIKAGPAKTQAPEPQPTKSEPIKVEPIRIQPLKTEAIRTEPIKAETFNPETSQPFELEPAESQQSKTENDSTNLRGPSPGEITSQDPFRVPKQSEIDNKIPVQGTSSTSTSDQSEIINTTALTEEKGLSGNLEDLASIISEGEKSHESTDSGSDSDSTDGSVSSFDASNGELITFDRVEIETIDGDTTEGKIEKSNQLDHILTSENFKQDEPNETPVSKPDESSEREAEVFSQPPAEEVISNSQEHNSAQISDTEEPSKLSDPSLPPSEDIPAPVSDDKLEDDQDNKSQHDQDNISDSETLNITEPTQPETESEGESHNRPIFVPESTPEITTPPADEIITPLTQEQTQQEQEQTQTSDLTIAVHKEEDQTQPDEPSIVPSLEIGAESQPLTKGEQVSYQDQKEEQGLALTGQTEEGSNSDAKGLDQSSVDKVSEQLVETEDPNQAAILELDESCQPSVDVVDQVSEDVVESDQQNLEDETPLASTLIMGDDNSSGAVDVNRKAPDAADSIDIATDVAQEPTSELVTVITSVPETTPSDLSDIKFYVADPSDSSNSLEMDPNGFNLTETGDVASYQFNLECTKLVIADVLLWQYDPNQRGGKYPKSMDFTKTTEKLVLKFEGLDITYEKEDDNWVFSETYTSNPTESEGGSGQPAATEEVEQQSIVDISTQSVEESTSTVPDASAEDTASSEQETQPASLPETTPEQTKVEQQQQPEPQESKEETDKPPEETEPAEESAGTPVKEESRESAPEESAPPVQATASDNHNFTLVIDASEHDPNRYEVTKRDEDTIEFTMKNGNKCVRVEINGKRVWEYDSKDVNAKHPVSMKHDKKRHKVKINFGTEIESFSTK